MYNPFAIHQPYMDEEIAEVEDTSLTIVLHDRVIVSDSPGVELKSNIIRGTTNLGGESDDFFRSGLIDEELDRKSITVQCDMVRVVHGTMIDYGPPATLVVFQFGFVSRDKNKRFKKAEIAIDFGEGELMRISPCNKSVAMRSERTKVVSHSVNPSLEAAYGPAKAGVGYTWQSTETRTLQHHADIIGVITSSSGIQDTEEPNGRTKHTREPNRRVTWTMSENDDAKDGVPHFLQTALLLQRKKARRNELFTADISIKLDFDNLTSLTQMTRGLFTSKRRGNPIRFNPARTIDNLQDCKVKDMYNLGQEDLDIYKKILTISDWVDGSALKPEDAQNLGPDETITSLDTGVISINSLKRVDSAPSSTPNQAPSNTPDHTPRNTANQAPSNDLGIDSVPGNKLNSVLIDSVLMDDLKPNGVLDNKADETLSNKVAKALGNKATGALADKALSNKADEALSNKPGEGPRDKGLRNEAVRNKTDEALRNKVDEVLRNKLDDAPRNKPNGAAHNKPDEVPRNTVDKATHNKSDEAPANKVDNATRNGPDVIASPMADKPRIPQNAVEVRSCDAVTEADIEEQLALVRAEADLVRQLVQLARQEKELVVELRRLQRSRATRMAPDSP